MTCATDSRPAHYSGGTARGVDVERELPRLATYLGHVHVNETYWYLEAIPELLQLATKRLAPTDLVSTAKGEKISAADSLGIADCAYGEVRKVSARDETTVTPMRGQEISRVLARRLFENIDPQGAATTADAYMEVYRRTAMLLPEQARQESYRWRLVAHYHFHPTLIDVLTEKLATVETFQGTRGVLRILALSVTDLWRRQATAPMIHACHLDLRDPRLADELVSRTASAELMPIVNADIGGPDSGDLKAEDSNAALADRANAHPDGLCSDRLWSPPAALRLDLPMRPECSFRRTTQTHAT